MSFAQGTDSSGSKPNQRTFAACSKCGKELHRCSVQKCPHKVVNRKFGPNICMYCCRGCDHNIFEGNGQACKLKRAARSNANLDKNIEKDTPTTT